MQTLEYKNWKLAFDPEATRHAYAQVDSGSAEQCGCSYCLNFAAVRDRTYPREVLDLFEKLGIDYKKESECYQTHRERPGRHFYGWWLHFVGRIAGGQDINVSVDEETRRLELVDVTDDLAIGFTEQTALVWEPFEGQPLVQVEFHAYLPWGLEVEEPDEIIK